MTYKLNKEPVKSPYEQMETRFKLFSSELVFLNDQIETVENSTEEVDPTWYEKHAILTDNIDVLLRRVVELGYVKTAPLEEKVYPISFPGRFNGKLRKTW